MHIIARHFPRAEYMFKMEEFIQGITSNMTSTQVCDVCCSNIDSVARDIISYTNETNIFTTDIRSISNPLIANIVCVFFFVSFFCGLVYVFIKCSYYLHC